MEPIPVMLFFRVILELVIGKSATHNVLCPKCAYHFCSVILCLHESIAALTYVLSFQFSPLIMYDQPCIVLPFLPLFDATCVGVRP